MKLNVSEQISVPEIYPELLPWFNQKGVTVHVNIGAYYEGGFSPMYYDLFVNVDFGELNVKFGEGELGVLMANMPAPHSEGFYTGDDPWQLFNDLRVALSVGRIWSDHLRRACPDAIIVFSNPFMDDEEIVDTDGRFKVTEQQPNSDKEEDLFWDHFWGH